LTEPTADGELQFHICKELTMRTLSRPLTARSHNEPIFYLHHVPGGRVITRQTDPNKWETVIQGGHLNGKCYCWRELCCAIDGHFHALQLTQHTGMIESDPTI
jgi:hypothetical protein